MQKTRFGKILLALLISVTLVTPLVILSGCGDGGFSLTNQAPQISELSAALDQVNPGASTNVTCVARDQDRDEVTYAWSATGGAIDGSGSTVTWVAPTQPGDYTIKVVVSDGKGGEADKSINVNVLTINASPPFIKKVTYDPNRYDVYDDEKVTFTCSAVSPDGLPITYHWEVDGGKIVPEGDGHIAVWTTPIELNEKEHMMTVYVTDSVGNRSTKQFVTLNIMCDCYREGAPKK